MQPPSVEVRYRGLSVLSRMTVGDRSLPTLKKTIKRQAEVGAGGGLEWAGGRGEPRARRSRVPRQPQGGCSQL